MHLEDERRPRPGRRGVVRQRRPVRGAYLTKPGAGGDEQVGQPEAVADLDQLTPADHDLLGVRAPQRGGREDQGGRVVVDHRDRLGGRNRPGQGVERTRAAAGADPGGQVELHVAGARRRHDGVHRGGGQRRAAQVGVHQHPGRVDHRGQRGGPRGQLGDGRVGDLLGGDLPVPGLLLGAAYRRLDQRRGPACVRPPRGADRPAAGPCAARCACYPRRERYPAEAEYSALLRVGGGQYKPATTKDRYSLRK